jgi:uncharacterized protein YfaS (alpha-2-macroglobulin family)
MYYPGAEVRLSVALTLTDTGAAADPTTLAVKLKDPAGTIATYTYGTAPEVTKDSTGNYHADITLSSTSDSAGRWYWRWEATGAVVGATEGSFIVRETSF